MKTHNLKVHLIFFCSAAKNISAQIVIVRKKMELKMKKKLLLRATLITSLIFSISGCKYLNQTPEITRPQDPKKPYPYTEKELIYKNKKDDVTLAGTLTVPNGKGPFPAVIMISGSGPQDRNEALAGHRPFLIWSDYLTRHGIAVLRVDDRGVGSSSGNVNDSTTEDFAGDVLVGVEQLKKQSRINLNQIGLIGHSEGGIIAPLAAVKSNDIAFIVLLAGSGLTGEEILRMQKVEILEADKINNENIKIVVKALEQAINALKNIKDPGELKQEISTIYSNSYIHDPESKGLTKEEFIEENINFYTSTWMKYFLTYNPRTTLEKVKCPVLALVGEKDLQVPPKENLTAIKVALIKGSNEDITVLELPDINHLFQTAVTGSPTEYSKIEETVSPTVLELVTNWILERTIK
jgi:uncharacterized protein